MHQNRTTRALAGLAALLLTLAASGCGGGEPEGQRAFDTPEAGAQALMEALKQPAPEPLLAVLGPEYREQLVTADWDAQADVRREIADAAVESLEIVARGEGEMELVVGSDEWPVPVPLVREEDGSWRFDTAEGIEEIIDRRVGRNELAAIALSHAYVDAQIEYAKQDRTGDDVREYARRLASSAGQRDGLYWPDEPGQPESPFGPLVERAERYLDTVEPGDPLRGYYFRILERQGENPPGGAYDYVINDHMIAGFGLVAWPAEYGNTGVMTFVVNHQGKVFQKDIADPGGIDAYDPDDSWTRVTD